MTDKLTELPDEWKDMLDQYCDSKDVLETINALLASGKAEMVEAFAWSDDAEHAIKSNEADGFKRVIIIELE